jgi:hypothetical protein
MQHGSVMHSILFLQIVVAVQACARHATSSFVVAAAQ